MRDSGTREIAFLCGDAEGFPPELPRETSLSEVRTEPLLPYLRDTTLYVSHVPSIMYAWNQGYRSELIA